MHLILLFCVISVKLIIKIDSSMNRKKKKRTRQEVKNTRIFSGKVILVSTQPSFCLHESCQKVLINFFPDKNLNCSLYKKILSWSTKNLERTMTKTWTSVIQSENDKKNDQKCKECVKEIVSNSLHFKIHQCLLESTRRRLNLSWFNEANYDLKSRRRRRILINLNDH